jgi:hypothetical protein
MEVSQMRKYLPLLFLLSMSNQNTLANEVNEDVVVLSCSVEDESSRYASGRLSREKFTEFIKIVKINNEIIKVVVGDEILTKEKRAVNPSSPNFLRWFEVDSDGITAYGEQLNDSRGPSWNVKLSSRGEFRRQGVTIRERGVCSIQVKAF